MRSTALLNAVTLLSWRHISSCPSEKYRFIISKATVNF